MRVRALGNKAAHYDAELVRRGCEARRRKWSARFRTYVKTSAMDVNGIAVFTRKLKAAIAAEDFALDRPKAGGDLWPI